MSLPAPPYINRCNCSVCSKFGVRWGYCPPADVIVAGEPLQSYVRSDLTRPELAYDRCARCGCLVRWRAIVERANPDMGVNMNLFAPEAIVGAAAFVLNSGWHGAMPSTILNIIWCAIGVVTLSRRLVMR